MKHKPSKLVELMKNHHSSKKSDMKKAEPSQEVSKKFLENFGRKNK